MEQINNDMTNKNTGAYGQNDRNPQQKNQQYDAQMNKDRNQAKNTAKTNPQRSPENGRDSNVPSSVSGSDKVNQVDIEIGKRLENQDAENTNTVPNAGEHIANAENLNDENIQKAIHKAKDHIPQDSSRKPNDDTSNR